MADVRTKEDSAARVEEMAQGPVPEPGVIFFPPRGTGDPGPPAEPPYPYPYLSVSLASPTGGKVSGLASQGVVLTATGNVVFNEFTVQRVDVRFPGSSFAPATLNPNDGWSFVATSKPIKSPGPVKVTARVTARRTSNTAELATDDTTVNVEIDLTDDILPTVEITSPAANTVLAKPKPNGTYPVSLEAKVTDNAPAAPVVEYTLVDPLGRVVRAVTRDGQSDANRHTTLTSYDIVGNALDVTDELGRVAFQHVYDLAGHPLCTEQLDSGVRTLVVDAAGEMVEQRDSRGALALHSRDMAHRPVPVWLADDAEQPTTLRQVLACGDAADSELTPEEATAANLLGVVVRHYDEAGLIVTERRDIDSNAIESTRRVVSDEQLLTVFEAAAGEAWQVRPWRMDWQPPTGCRWLCIADALLEDAELLNNCLFRARGSSPIPSVVGEKRNK